MSSSCIFVYTILTFFISNSESRVFCQDKNALSWTSFGYSCPVTCNSVVQAIEKLKEMDLKRSVGKSPEKKLVNKLKPDKSNYHEFQNFYGTVSRRDFGSFYNKEDKNFSKMYEEINITNEMDVEKFMGIIEKEISRSNDNIMQDNANDNKVNTIDLGNNEIDTNSDDSFSPNEILKINDIPESMSKVIQIIQSGCWDINNFNITSFRIQFKRIACTRRFNFDKRLLILMTNILNHYVKSRFKFTAEITEVLLEQLFGKNTDLRNNIFDVNNLLRFLRRAISLHSQHTYKQKLELKPKHCMLISVPGCYCKPSFVESYGQCIKPNDCIENKDDQAYLTRIIVH